MSGVVSGMSGACPGHVRDVRGVSGAVSLPDPLRRFASEAGIDEGSESRGLCFARGFAAVALELLWTFAPDIPKTRSQVSVLREEEVQEFRFRFFTASRGQFLRIRTKVRRTEECERV